MLSSLFALLGSEGLFWMLRVSPVTGSFPQPLSAAREREALLAMQEGDAAARDLLIEHNLRLVAHVVKKYYASREDQDDLVSIGTIGLIKAVSTFKSDTPVWFEGIHRFDQADGADGDQVLLFLCLGIVFFDNMCHKAQVALYQHIAGVQIALGTPFQIRLLLLRCQRLRK